jgi:hypothetical protein
MSLSTYDDPNMLPVTLLPEQPNDALQTSIISVIIDAAPRGLTNQEIRLKLHQSGQRQLTKGDINKTLHVMRADNVVDYRQEGRDKRWSCL